MQYKAGQYVLWHESEVRILEVYQYSKKALIEDTVPNDFGEYDSRLVLLNELGEETYDENEEYDVEVPEPEAVADVLAKIMAGIMPLELWCLSPLAFVLILGIVKAMI